MRYPYPSFTSPRASEPTAYGLDRGLNDNQQAQTQVQTQIKKKTIILRQGTTHFLDIDTIELNDHGHFLIQSSQNSKYVSPLIFYTIANLNLLRSQRCIVSTSSS